MRRGREAGRLKWKQFDEFFRGLKQVGWELVTWVVMMVGGGRTIGPIFAGGRGGGGMMAGSMMVGKWDVHLDMARGMMVGKWDVHLDMAE